MPIPAIVIHQSVGPLKLGTANNAPLQRRFEMHHQANQWLEAKEAPNLGTCRGSSGVQYNDSADPCKAVSAGKAVKLAFLGADTCCCTKRPARGAALQEVRASRAPVPRPDFTGDVPATARGRHVRPTLNGYGAHFLCMYGRKGFASEHEGDCPG